MNELDLIKLNIYESYDNGELSYGEKEYLLEQINYMYEADAYAKRIRRLSDMQHENLRKGNRRIREIVNNKIHSLENENKKKRGYMEVPAKGEDFRLGDDSPENGAYISRRRHESYMKKYADKLDNKAPGSILAIQNAKKQKAQKEYEKLQKAGFTKDEAKHIQNVEKRSR